MSRASTAARLLPRMRKPALEAPQGGIERDAGEQGDGGSTGYWRGAKATLAGVRSGLEADSMGWGGSDAAAGDRRTTAGRAAKGGKQAARTRASPARRPCRLLRPETLPGIACFLGARCHGKLCPSSARKRRGGPALSAGSRHHGAEAGGGQSGVAGRGKALHGGGRGGCAR